MDMQISAKFQTVCPTCRHRIVVGERIEWERGKPALHVKCPDAQSTMPETARQPNPHKPAPAYHSVGDDDASDSAGLYSFD